MTIDTLKLTAEDAHRMIDEGEVSSAELVAGVPPHAAASAAEAMTLASSSPFTRSRC